MSFSESEGIKTNQVIIKGSSSPRRLTPEFVRDITRNSENPVFVKWIYKQLEEQNLRIDKPPTYMDKIKHFLSALFNGF